ncbi:MAG: glycosyltransferase family 4 protein [Paraprevotella sp.]|nr:glycosyltransferase family 4 protein [Paraprevotella sp.]
MELSKCLYVNFKTSGNFGGGKFNETVLSILQEIFKEVDLCTFPLEMSRWRNLKNTMGGYLNGMDQSVTRSVISRVKSESYDWVFLASSNFGELAKELRKYCPGLKICVLCNNIEYNFISSQLKTGCHLQLLLTLWVTWRSERNVAKYADKIIVLNERERNELKRIYDRDADAVIPIVLRDEYTGTHEMRSQERRKPLRGLFVGSNFYANKHAVEWFAKHVAPYTPEVTYEIVGKGFETEKYLEQGNFKIVGTVDGVSEYYEKADFVIAPIFKGAGMKVKIAEALMYGKTVIGTPEAFEGYCNVDLYGKVCKDASEFIQVINSMDFMTGYNPVPRQCFLASYEYKAVKGMLANLFYDKSK